MSRETLLEKGEGFDVEILLKATSSKVQQPITGGTACLWLAERLKMLQIKVL